MNVRKGCPPPPCKGILQPAGWIPSPHPKGFFPPLCSHSFFCFFVVKCFAFRQAWEKRRKGFRLRFRTTVPLPPPLLLLPSLLFKGAGWACGCGRKTVLWFLLLLNMRSAASLYFPTPPPQAEPLAWACGTRSEGRRSIFWALLPLPQEGVLLLLLIDCKNPAS